MTALYEIGDKTVTVCRVLVVRLDLVEGVPINHAYLVLNQDFNLICQSAGLKLYVTQPMVVREMSICTHLATIEDIDIDIALLTPSGDSGASTDSHALCYLPETTT
jgi:hypothetical protein